MGGPKFETVGDPYVEGRWSLQLERSKNRRRWRLTRSGEPFTMMLTENDVFPLADLFGAAADDIEEAKAARQAELAEIGGFEAVPAYDREKGRFVS